MPRLKGGPKDRAEYTASNLRGLVNFGECTVFDALVRAYLAGYHSAGRNRKKMPRHVLKRAGLGVPRRGE